MSRYGRFTRWLLLERIGVVALKLALLVVATRVLGASGQGVLSLVMVACTMAAGVTVLGMDLSNNHYGSSDSDPRALLGNSLVAVVVSSVVLVAVLWMLLQVSGVFDAVPPESRGLLLIGGSVMPGFVILGGLLYGFRKFRLHTLGTVASGGIAILLLLYVSIHGEANSRVAIGAWLIGQATAVIIWLAGLLVSPGFPTVGIKLLKEQLTYGVRSSIWKVSMIAMLRTDVILVGALLGSYGVGLYMIAVSVAEAMLHIPKALSALLIGKEGASHSELEKLLSGGIGIMSVSAAALLLGGYCIVPYLFGAEVKETGNLIAIIIGGALIHGAGLFATYVAFGAGRPEQVAWVPALSAVVMIVFDLILIPIVGVVGAAIATAVSYSVFGGWGMWRAVQSVEYLSWTWFVPTVKSTKRVLSQMVTGVAEVHAV